MTEENQIVDDIHLYWFGKVESSILPSDNRTKIWFGATKEVDDNIREQFGEHLKKAIYGDYDHWEKTPRGSLSLIILLDQFSRHIYRKTPMSFTQDQKALDVCVRGIERQQDHTLSLIERIFFYIPLMHSENLDMQTTSVRAFKMLLDLSFPEARSTFENFFEYALKHYEIVERFGRFPHRNALLGRNSTPEEEAFLSQSPPSWGQ